MKNIILYYKTWADLEVKFVGKVPIWITKLKKKLFWGGVYNVFILGEHKEFIIMMI